MHSYSCSWIWSLSDRKSLQVKSELFMKSFMQNLQLSTDFCDLITTKFLVFESMFLKEFFALRFYIFIKNLF
jgi:hypothetical protein